METTTSGYFAKLKLRLNELFIRNLINTYNLKLLSFLN